MDRFPSLDSSWLEAFLACARTGQATTAAHSLFITQSALSQRLRKLEDALGRPLFVRSRQGMALTNDGRSLVRHCLLVEAQERAFLSHWRGEARPPVSVPVRVGAFSSVARTLVLEALAVATQERPEVAAVLSIEPLHALSQRLDSGSLDFAVLDVVHGTDRYAYDTIGHERYVLVERADGKSADAWLDCDAQDVTTRTYLGAVDAAKLKRHFLGDVDALVRGVLLGMGRAVLPRHLVRNEKGLRVVSPRKELRSPVILHGPPEALLTPAQKAVRDALRMVGQHTLRG